jgi:transposase
MSEASEQRPGGAVPHEARASPDLSRNGRPSAVELRRLALALVRAGRTPEALSHELEPTVQEIWNWVMQVARDAGRHADGLTRAEREELKHLRREVRQLREERDRLAEADTWFARDIGLSSSGAST